MTSVLIGLIAAEVVIIFVLVVLIMRSAKETKNVQKQLKKICREEKAKGE